MAAPRIEDELLSAWVDGELDPLERARVEEWLHAHPDDMARVRAWQSDRAALAAMFAPALDESTPEPFLKTVWRHRAAGRQRLWAQAAAAAGLLVAGSLLGGAAAWHWQEQRFSIREATLRSSFAAGTAEGWVQRAAYAHSIYVAEPKHAVEVRAQEDHLAVWLTKRTNIPVKLFDLHEQGFALVGGRLLPDGAGRSAQLMYEDAQRHRVTVYLRRPEQGTDAAFRYEQQGRLGMFYWVEEGAGYALLGELPKELLLAMAQSIYRQLVTAPAATPPGPGPATSAAKAS